MAQFVSFVGTQIMGTLNPILGVMGRKGHPENFLLLHTPVTINQAEKITNWLLKRFPGINIQKEEVPSNLSIDKIPFEKNVVTYFNLSGGMNYQVASFIWQYVEKEGDSKLKFIYSERECIWLFDIAKHQFESLSPCIELRPEKILDIQGVPYEKIVGDEVFSNLLKKSGKEDVLSLKLGNIEFDNVIATNNFLNLIKFVDKSYNNDKIRRLIAFCGKNRQELKELHSFKVYIFSNDIKTLERFDTESIGDVETIYFNFEKKDKINLDFLEKENASSLAVQISKHFMNSEIIENFKNGSTLYVVMSPELTNTMKAIGSHQFSNLCLIYTPGDRRLEKIISKIRNKKIILPNKGGLKLLSTDISGYNLLKMEKFGDGEVIVNITPGSKSHAGMLTLWGMRNNAKIYSINNSTKTIDSLDGLDKIEIKDPPLKLLLELRDDIKDFGKELDYSREKYFNSIIMQFKELKGRLTEKRNLTDAEFNEEIIKILGKKCKDGHFFEILAGFAFNNIGCSQISIGVKTNWSDEGNKNNSEIHGEKVFKSEIDIVCIFEGTYLAISTKISSPETKVKLTSEIKAQSEILGRMSIPILVILKYQGPPEINNGVIVIGWKTLFDEEELKNVIRTTIESKKTTKQEK